MVLFAIFEILLIGAVFSHEKFWTAACGEQKNSSPPILHPFVQSLYYSDDKTIPFDILCLA